MKTKITVDFNGSRQGLKLSAKCDPEKEIFILCLAKKGNIWNYFSSITLTNAQWQVIGPNWHRDWKFICYEYIDGEAVVIDVIENKRYGTTTNFYLLGGESIETHFIWCNTINEYAQKFQCKVHIESEYADALAPSFPNLEFYTEMPSVVLRSNYLGYNVCRDLTQPNRMDWQTNRIDIQFYNWWHPKPPHNLSDKEIVKDIIFGPDLSDPFFDINRSSEETIESLYLIIE